VAHSGGGRGKPLVKLQSCLPDRQINDCKAGVANSFKMLPNFVVSSLDPFKYSEPNVVLTARHHQAFYSMFTSDNFEEFQ
jgi:hypothetical protein